MKSENINKLISILMDETTWISGTELSKIIQVDKKTIRNYIQELNNSGDYKINSSQKGYKLKTSTTIDNTISTNTPKERAQIILYKLLSNKNGISIFDLADELCVSESTIMNDVGNQLKSLISIYHLEINSKDYTLILNGDESNKRKLIGYIATHNSNGYFSSTETLQKLTPYININQIGDKLKQFCKESNLSINSYALNNLLIHIIIIIIRLQSNNSLPSETMENQSSILDNNVHKNEILDFANKISNYCSKLTDKNIPKNDFRQILLLISLSIENISDTQIELDSFSSFIEKDFFKFVINSLIELKNKYNLFDFDNEFICQFTLHSYNLLQRAKYNVSYPNPLASQIKHEYAPIYDMAVYYSHLMSKKYHITILEDEIGFIAFHIGSYLESHQPKSDKISCLIIAEDYHTSSRRLIHELHMSFGEELTVVDMIPFSDYAPNIHADLIISSTIFDYPHPHVVFVNPIITKKNILLIHEEISKIEQEKKNSQTITLIHKIFQKKLYRRNIKKNSPQEYIQYLCELAQEYVNDEFVSDVLAREAISSTAFTDQVAIPHSISVYTKKSFVCILHNNTPINWNKKKVNFVLLIGVAEKDMGVFRSVFDKIVDSFSSIENTVTYLKSSSYEEFIQILSR